MDPSQYNRIAHNAVSESRHFLAKNTGMAVAKGGLTFLYNGGHTLTHQAGGLMHGVNQMGTGMGLTGGAAAVGGLGGLVAMGVLGVISAVVAQMDYRHGIHKMREIYKHEIAHKLDKPVKSVTDEDLYLLAEGDKEKGIEPNGVLAKEISQKRTDRVISIALSAAASMATFGIMGIVGSLAVATLPVAAPIAAALGLSVAAVAPVVGLLAETLIGVGLYNAIKEPLHWATRKVFKLDENTTHDRIEKLNNTLAAGKSVSQQQVLDVFVSADKELDKYITNQYGKSFNRMNNVEKQQVADDLGKQQVPIADLTDRINSGKYDIGELAFAAEGKASGFAIQAGKMEDTGQKQGLLSAIWSELKEAYADIKSALGIKDKKPVQPQQTGEVQSVASLREHVQHSGHSQDAQWHPANEQVGKKSFEERYASGSRAKNLGTVERLEKARAESPAMGLNT
jgi:hypothetical protein